MNELKEWKLEMKILSAKKPDERRCYDAIRKEFHVKKLTYGWFRIERDWLTVTQVKSVLGALLR